MSQYLKKITLDILGCSATPYPPDYQSVTKTLLVFMGPPSFLQFSYICSRLSTCYVYILHFFLQ